MCGRVLLVLSSVMLGLAIPSFSADSGAGPYPTRARHYLDDLPFDIMQKICSHPHLGIVDRLKLAVHLKRIRTVARTAAIQALFESPSTTSYEVQDLIENLALLREQDPQATEECVSKVAPEHALGLLQYIRHSDRFSKSQRKSLMKILVHSLRVPFANDICTLKAVLKGNQLQELLNINKQVESKHIPQPVIEKIQQKAVRSPQLPFSKKGVLRFITCENSQSSSNSSDLLHGPKCRTDLRHLYGRPFCCVLLEGRLFSNDLISFDRPPPEWLVDPQVVRALRQNGIAFQYLSYIQTVTLPPESVVKIVPYLDCSDKKFLETIMSRYLQGASSDSTSYHVLKLPFVQRLIRDRPEQIFHAICALQHQHLQYVPLQHFVNLAELAFMPAIINRCCTGGHSISLYRCRSHHSLLGLVLKARRYDIATTVMSIPNISMYHRDANANRLSIFADIIRTDYTVLLDILCQEPFWTHLISSPEQLLQDLKLVVDWREAERCRHLVGHQFYWKIPADIRLNLLEYAKTRWNRQHIVDIFINATQL